MIKREFKARIVDNFREEWLHAVADEENIQYDLAFGYYAGEELDALHERISGRVVVMVHYAYPEGEDDFFEKEDNNFVIPRSLFTELV